MSGSFPHIATTAIVFCMDDRPDLDKKGYRQLVDSCPGGTAYSLRWGGASLGFLDANGQAFALKQVRLQTEKLGVKTIILADHMGCAACAGPMAESGLDEVAFHLEQMQAAAKVIQAEFDVKVQFKLFNEDGSEVALPQTTA